MSDLRRTAELFTQTTENFALAGEAASIERKK